MRKRNLWKKMAAIVLGIVTTVSTLVGCGSSDSSSSTLPSKESTQVVKIGIGNAYSPFCYLDENEKETGYDYEVLVEVENILQDKYTFEFHPDAFANLLIGLDTGAYDVAAHHFGYTEKRAENYLYSTEGDMYINNFVVAYPNGKTGITDLASCKGLTAVTTTGSKADNILQTWNAEHPDSQVNIAYADGTEVIETGLQNGLYDFYVVSEYDFEVFNKQYNNILSKSSNSSDYMPDANPGIYFIYSKGSTELQKDIDAAIVELRNNGKLAELSIKWLGEDYSQPTK